MPNKKKKNGGAANNSSAGLQQKDISPQEQLRNEYREKQEETGASPSKRPSPGFLFCASQLADGKMPSSKEDGSGSGEEKEIALPPMRGAKTSSVTDRHPQLMTKEVYMAKQNSVFKELSGYSSWKQLSEVQKSKDREDTYLTKITEYVIAGLDESIYNEFLEQRYIMDEVEYAGQEALSIVADEAPNQDRLKRLVKDFAALKAQVSRLELEFVKMRKARIAAETEVTDIRSYYQKEMIKRIKLEELCRCLNRKVTSYEKKSKERSQNQAVVSGDGESSHSSEAIDQWERTISRLIGTLSDPSSDKRSVKDKTRELKGALKLFFKQYKACEDYYRHRVSMKNLEIQVYLARLEKYKQTYEREAKRAQLLSEQVEISAKTENQLRERVMQCEEKLSESSGLIDQSQDMLDKVKNHMLAMKENQSLRDEVTELKKQLVQERRAKEYFKNLAEPKSGSSAPKPETSTPISKKSPQKPNGDKKMNGGVNSPAEESNWKHANEFPRAARTDDMSKIYRPGDRIIRKGFRGTVVDPTHPVHIKPGSTVVELGDEAGDIVPATYETFSNEAHKAWFKDSLLSAQEYHESKRTNEQQTPRKPDSEESESESEGEDEESEYDDYRELHTTYKEGHLTVIPREFDPRVTNQFLEGSIDRLGKAEQDDDDKTGVNTVDFFKELFGFDITGKSFSEILKAYAKHSAADCTEAKCPIHTKDSELSTTWEDLMMEFQSHSYQGPTSTHGSLVHSKPVFGPERPPDMRK